MFEEAAIKVRLPGVKEVHQVERKDRDYWARLSTYPNLNKRLFALLVFLAASRPNPLISRFAVQLDDGNSATWYTFSTITGIWAAAADAPDWVPLRP